MTNELSGLAPEYTFEEPSVPLGRAIKDDAIATDFEVAIPLRTLNRHGLVAGATGTGKTKTVQALAGRLSDLGIPCFLADMKGDASGIAEPAEPDERVKTRIDELKVTFNAHGAPVEILTLSGDATKGVPVRAAVSTFGAQLLSKILGLNDTQESVLNLVFHYADEKGLLLVNVEDLRAVFKHLASDEGKADLENIGGVSPATLGVLQRKLVELEEQGVSKLLGEPSFDVNDLLRVDGNSKGIVSVLELADVQDQPRVFSTFMMWMLAELFETLPEVGDTEKPKLVFFFDEAHLLFDDASKEFVDQVQRTVRLIRSKGVGVFFITQLPQDLPDEVLAQLGNRVQHALRAITPKDAQAIDKTVDTYPTSTLYDLEKALTSLAVGEAVVTVLSPKGVPTQVAWTRIYPPESKMVPASAETIKASLAASPLLSKYGTEVDPESAYEKLTARMTEAATAEPAASAPAESKADAPKKESKKKQDDGVDAKDVMRVGNMALRFMETPTGRRIQRSIFGVLKRK